MEEKNEEISGKRKEKKVEGNEEKEAVRLCGICKSNPNLPTAS